MSSVFSTNLLMLRKERGFSQKQVSQDLGVSQALLSHYEKGIRECGLEFVVRACEYYEVSSDFLLGVKQKITDEKKASTKTDEEKMISHSINIVFLILKKINSKKLFFEVTNYLSTSVYTILRFITNSKEFCTVDNEIYSSLASSNMTMNKAKIRMIIKDEKLTDKLPTLHANDESQKSLQLKELVDFAELKMKND